MAATQELNKLPTVDSVLFDLDGTLWDVTELVAKARNRALDILGIPHRPFTREDIARYIGLPVDEIYRIVFPHLSLEQQKQLRVLTTQTIADLLPTEGATLYDGVPEGLATLKRSYRLFIVSNCGKGYIENFLNWSGLGPLFEGHECYGNTLKPKGENIALVRDRSGVRAPLYVGDTEGDHSAAMLAGVPYAHVNYGFGKPKGPCPSFNTFPDLVSSLLASRT